MSDARNMLLPTKPRLQRVSELRPLQPLRPLSPLRGALPASSPKLESHPAGFPLLSFAEKRRLRLSVKLADTDVPQQLGKDQLPVVGFDVPDKQSDNEATRKLSFAEKRRQKRGKSMLDVVEAKVLERRHKLSSINVKVQKDDILADVEKGTLASDQKLSSPQGFAQRRRTRQAAAASLEIDIEKKREEVQTKLALINSNKPQRAEEEKESEEVVEHRITIAPEVDEKEDEEEERNEVDDSDLLREEIELARQARAKRNASVTAAPEEDTVGFLGSIVNAFNNTFIGSFLSEFWTEFWSLRSQTRRTLRAELDSVVLPPHWKTLTTEGSERLRARYPTNAVLCLSNLRVGLLTEDPRFVHPVVRVSLIDVRSGVYLEKAHKDWSVVAHYENVYEHNEVVKSSLVLPQMTHPCKLQGARVLAPFWNEDMVFNESLEHFFKPHAFAVFELLDFGVQVDLQQHPSGYLPIAWAFLKLLGSRGQPNDGEVKLQLYKHVYVSERKLPRRRRNVPSVYFEMISQKILGRQPYPSTLSLNVRGIASPIVREVKGRRPFLPTDVEVGRVPFDEMRQRIDSTTTLLPGDVAQQQELSSVKLRLMQRQRMHNEPCLVPKDQLHRLSCGQLGCFVVQFSPDGKYLAAGCAELVMFPIKIFVVETGQLDTTLVGHHDLIHDLNWSSDSQFLASASSDETAKVWRARDGKEVCSMQHRTFVYAARLHPIAKDPAILVTASYDTSIRVWNANSGTLLYELKDHTAFVNSLTFDGNGDRFFSGDAAGMIKVWAWNQPNSRYRCEKTFTHPEIKGDVISCICFHPLNEAMVVYCRDNALYIFGLRRYNLRRKLCGTICESLALRCAFSPDGNYVMAASEDGRVLFWKVSSGEPVYTLNLDYGSPAFGVAWHPTQHLVAFSSFGGDHPIYMFDRIKADRALESVVIDATATDSKKRSKPVAPITLPGSFT